MIKYKLRFKKINKEAKKIRKALKNDITPMNIIKYINTLGYLIVFYDEDTLLLKEFDLVEYSKTVKAFTYVSDVDRYVFIKKDLHIADIKYTLLHEMSHIVLGHLDIDEVLRNKREEEMQAEVLAYNIIKYSAY